MRINKMIFANMMAMLDGALPESDVRAKCARTILIELKNMPEDEVEIHGKKENNLFADMLNMAAGGVKSDESETSIFEQVLNGISEFTGHKVEIVPSKDLIGVQTWRKKDIEDAFEHAGITFTEERYQKILSDIKSIILDMSDAYDKLIKLIEETFTVAEDPRVLWREFGKVPKSELTRKLEESWRHFPKGTAEGTVWEWFEKTYNISVEELIYGM